MKLRTYLTPNHPWRTVVRDKVFGKVALYGRPKPRNLPVHPVRVIEERIMTSTITEESRRRLVVYISIKYQEIL